MAEIRGAPEQIHSGRGWDSRCPMDLLLSSLLLLTAGNDNGKSCSVYSTRTKKDTQAEGKKERKRERERESRLNNTDTWWFTMKFEERLHGEENGTREYEIFVFRHNVQR